MYTFEFTYNEDVDGFGSIRFCAESQTEAEELFHEWNHENGYDSNIGEDYSVEIVYDESDAREYGDSYLVKLED